MTIEELFRREHGKVFARLASTLDWDLAEDALQDAFIAALEHWPRDGVPDRPAAWIHAVARNAALSRKRHETVARRKHDLIRLESVEVDEDIPDERLRLLFLCCHPALAEEARIALTLRAVCGLTTSAIARLLLMSEVTVAQRIVRAKRKIKAANMTMDVPADHLEERRDTVLACIYLMFTEGYSPSDGELVTRAELCEEALRLVHIIVRDVPAHGEARGLQALMKLHHARRHARIDAAGEIMTLEEQDRRLWDRAPIDEGQRELGEALARGAPGPYQIQAAIAALHAEAESYESTDWPQIAGLYTELYRRMPSPAIAVGLAIAEGMARGPDEGLALLERLAPGYDRVPAARAELLRRADRRDEARSAYHEAIAVARHEREGHLLRRRLQSL